MRLSLDEAALPQTISSFTLMMQDINGCHLDSIWKKIDIYLA